MLSFIVKRVLKGLLCVWFIWTLVFVLVRSLIRDKKAGKSACGGSCAGCGGCASCGMDPSCRSGQ